MARRVVVVTPVALDGAAVDRLLHEHAGADAETYVVVPAADVSKLDLWTGDVDDALAEAEQAASETSRTAGVPAAAVGEADPVQAVEDALRLFGDADEIVIVTRPDAEAAWLEGGEVAEALRRFRLPVVHLVLDEAGPHEPEGEAARPYVEEHDVARGAEAATPAKLLGRVALLVWGVAGLIAVILVILWLALK